MSVTTTYASNLNSLEITLSGTLDDLHGEASLDVSFEWGATTSYGNVTTPETVSATGSISADISSSSLDAFHTTGNVYHFRAKATDGILTWYGYDRQFAVLNVKGSDPYVIDNTMTAGVLTDVVSFENVLRLDYLNALYDNTEFNEAKITSISNSGIYELIEFNDAAITGVTIT